LSIGDVPEGVFVAESVPFDWLFPQAAAVVIHGGIGTTATAMRAGVPAAVVPFTADQTFWGEQVHRLGIGPAPIPHSRLTVDKLTRAIRVMTGDRPMRERARRLGERMRAEDGVASAVKIIEGYLST
jgi:sterol 3beta-glucosyltransferase